ncbi:MAG: hypothetical protein HFH72_07075 [Lachnospiraceae bacterium]|nr:hypothetical protein [Lachnospiraceae bacterium]
MNEFPQEFMLSDLVRLIRKAVKGMDSASHSNIHELSEEFSLKEKTPGSVWHRGKKVELDENMAAVWEYFHERIDCIRECINRCFSKQLKEETVFGLSFFDLIKRKPVNIKYSVMNVFQRVKDRQYVHLLPECRDTCRAEIGKFRKALLQNVDFENNYLDDDLEWDKIDELLADSSRQCQLFFNGMQKNGELLFSDIRSTDMELLIEIFCLIDRVDSQGVAAVLNVHTDDFDSFCENAVILESTGLTAAAWLCFGIPLRTLYFLRGAKLRNLRKTWRNCPGI